MAPRFLLFALALCASTQADAERSRAARADFQRMSPCPATGQTRGPCRGWIVDHRTPLACGGADAPHNMQWQTTSDARAKDRIERAGCERRSATH